MKTFSVYYNSFEHLKLYVERNEFKKARIKSKSLLIQVFSGVIDSEIIKMVVNDIKTLLPSAKIIGATTCGEILNGVMSSYKIALSFSFFENTEVFTAIVKKGKQTEFEMVKHISSPYFTPQTKAILSFATVYKLSADVLLKAFDKYFPGVPIIGGGAGDNLEHSVQYVFTDEFISDNAVALAFFNSSVLDVNSNYFLNWQTVGKSFVITSAEKNKIKTINNQPAAQIYTKYIGKELNDSVKDSLEFPLIFFKDDIQIAREVTAILPNSELELSANVEVGDVFKFSYGYIDYFIPTHKDYAEKFHNLAAESIFVYASVSHLTLLQEVVNLEISPLQQIASVSGFFTYSEFCRNNSKNVLQSNTLSVVLFNENLQNDALLHQTNKQRNEIIKNRHYSIIKIQNHLLTTINQELNETAEEQRKTNIEMQKLVSELFEKQQIIKEHNKKILDSIKYAKRIQTAVIPPTNLITQIIPHHFVYYQPRDIVSGDFYWVFKHLNKIYFAVADCTGHGVPGAFMSLLGISILNELISNTTVTSYSTPAIILDMLQYRMKSVLNQEFCEQETHDGMDIAFAIFDTESRILSFAGANQNLLIIKNNELSEIKGDRIAIGRHPRDNMSFQYFDYKVSGTETFYLFTDGFKDQIGGIKRRKYMGANFKNFLLRISKEELQQQKNLIEKEFVKWKGDEEQTDDILVMGIQFPLISYDFEYNI